MAAHPAPAVPAGRNLEATHPERVDRAAYPFADHWLDLPAGRMHYVDEGAAPGRETLLFAHGTPTWSFEWRHLIRALSSGYRCVAPDHLGFGLSERPDGFAYTPEAHAENFAAFARALDLRDITLVVHDFGGPIGLPLALRGDGRVKRIVVINSWMWGFAGDRSMEKAARLAGTGLWRFFYRRFDFSLKVLMPYAYGDKRKLTPAIHGQYRDRFPDADSRGRVLWALAKALLGSSAHYDSLWRRRAELAGLAALIVWGRKDRAFPPGLLARWREALPHARVAELAGSGHWPHEEEPEAVIAAMRGFLAG